SVQPLAGPGEGARVPRRHAPGGGGEGGPLLLDVRPALLLHAAHPGGEGGGRGTGDEGEGGGVPAGGRGNLPVCESSESLEEANVRSRARACREPALHARSALERDIDETRGGGVREVLQVEHAGDSTEHEVPGWVLVEVRHPGPLEVRGVRDRI